MHVEIMTAITRGLPRLMLDRLRDMGGWAADRLREHGMEAALVDQFEQALAALPSQEDFRRTSDEDWTAARVHWHQRLEYLLGAARGVVGVQAARYFDYGVMLSRIDMCMRTVRLLSRISGLSESTTTTFADDVTRYRTELLRVTRQLTAFVLADGPSGPRDPRHRDLELKFREFAAYLTVWETESGEPDQDFQNRLRDVFFAAGFWTGDQIEQDVIWDLHSEVLSEREQLVLPVPHTAKGLQEIKTLWGRVKQLTATVGFEQCHDLLRELLDRCRCVLGPAHPLTLHIHVDLAAAHMFAGRAGRGTIMLLDVANTALHYYGPFHPSRYEIIRHAHQYLENCGSEYAQELYDFPLRSLVERDESQLPPVLHDVRKSIRRGLGLEPDPNPDS